MRVRLKYQRPDGKVVNIDTESSLLVECWCRRGSQLRADENCHIIYACKEESVCTNPGDDLFDFMEHLTFTEKCYMAMQTYEINMAAHRRKIGKDRVIMHVK